MALNAALPRTLNLDALTQVIDEKNVDELFDWLKKNPFVQDRGGRWAYHSVVRRSMLRFKIQQSPQGWATLHTKLADYYENLRTALALDEKNWTQIMIGKD